jgi:hypothetical protein
MNTRFSILAHRAKNPTSYQKWSVLTNVRGVASSCISNWVLHIVMIFVLWGRYVSAGTRGQQTTKSKVQPSDAEQPQLPAQSFWQTVKVSLEDFLHVLLIMTTKDLAARFYLTTPWLICQWEFHSCQMLMICLMLEVLLRDEIAFMRLQITKDDHLGAPLMLASLRSVPIKYIVKIYPIL